MVPDLQYKLICNFLSFSCCRILCFYKAYPLHNQNSEDAGPLAGVSTSVLASHNQRRHSWTQRKLLSTPMLFVQQSRIQTKPSDRTLFVQFVYWYCAWTWTHSHQCPTPQSPTSSEALCGISLLLFSYTLYWTTKLVFRLKTDLTHAPPAILKTPKWRVEEIRLTHPCWRYLHELQSFMAPD